MTVLSFSDLNWWAIIVATVIYMVLGSVWFSPSGFGKLWARALNRKTSEMSNANTGYTLTLVGALVQSFVLANFVRDLGLTTASEGVALGITVWLGFICFVGASETIFAGRPWTLWKINAGYYLVLLLVNGAVLAAWH